MSDKKPIRRKIEFQAFDHPEFWVGDFAAFAEDIGYVTWAWNALHADLCDLFWSVTGVHDPSIPRAIWYAILNDSGQRAALKSTAVARLQNDQECLQEIKWLLKEVDKIARYRNDATHTLWKVDFNSGNASPDLERGSPRAKMRLSSNSYKKVFRGLAGYCMTLVQFSRALDTRVRGWDDGEPLPERPKRPDILKN